MLIPEDMEFLIKKVATFAIIIKFEAKSICEKVI
jgi:hypothetical protein